MFGTEFIMTSFREAREGLLVAFSENLIDDEEFLLLYDLNTSKNPDIPYWSYERFDLETLTDDECWTEFRFLKNDIYEIQEVFRIPDEISTYNRVKIDGTEALCIFLKRFAYPCRYGDLIPRFSRPAPQLSMISNQISDHIYNNFNQLLRDLNQPWLSPQNLRLFADAVHQKGAPLNNCWGFVDGTVRPICRPEKNQRILYNGHKRVHSIKFQSVATPSGMIASLHGPFEGRKHDSGMLADTNLLAQLQQFSVDPAGRALAIYGDLAYPLRVNLQKPFLGPGLTPQQRQYNTAMSKSRISVEWVFGDIINYFAFLDFKKNLKIGLSAVGKMYISCALLTYAHTCLYHSMTSTYFGVDPPNLRGYFL